MSKNNRRFLLTTSESKHLRQLNSRPKNAPVRRNSIGTIKRFKSLKTLTHELTLGMLTTETNSKTRSGRQLMNKKRTMTRSTTKKTISLIKNYLIINTPNDLRGNKITTPQRRERRIRIVHTCQLSPRPIQRSLPKINPHLLRNIPTSRFSQCTSPKNLTSPQNLLLSFSLICPQRNKSCPLMKKLRLWKSLCRQLKKSNNNQPLSQFKRQKVDKKSKRPTTSTTRLNRSPPSSASNRRK